MTGERNAILLHGKPKQEKIISVQQFSPGATSIDNPKHGNYMPGKLSMVRRNLID